MTCKTCCGAVGFGSEGWRHIGVVAWCPYLEVDWPPPGSEDPDDELTGEDPLL